MTTPAHKSQLMDSGELKQWILRELGAPFLKVELNEEHLEDSVENARRWFVAKKGVTKLASIPVQLGETEYDLPDDVDSVTDVVFSTSPMDLSLVFSPMNLIDDKVPYDVFAAPSTAGLYSSFTQTLQYIDQAKRILGAEPDWRQQNRKLHIFPVPKNAVAILVEYKSNEVILDQLNERDHDLIKRYALAKAKQRVGRIRSKYDSFPTAQGTAILDGTTLLDEARAAIETLEEEISQSGYTIPFLVG